MADWCESEDAIRLSWGGVVGEGEIPNWSNPSFPLYYKNGELIIPKGTYQLTNTGSLFTSFKLPTGFFSKDCYPIKTGITLFSAQFNNKMGRKAIVYHNDALEYYGFTISYSYLTGASLKNYNGVFSCNLKDNDGPVTVIAERNVQSESNRPNQTIGFVFNYGRSPIEVLEDVHILIRIWNPEE